MCISRYIVQYIYCMHACMYVEGTAEKHYFILMQSPFKNKYILSRFNSWVAEAMGVKFLAQGNNSSRKPHPGIEPGTL